VDVQERLAASSSVTRSGRRWLHAAVWILPIGLVLLMLAVAAGMWAHEIAVNHHWPERITVNGRDYDDPVPVSAAEVRAEGHGWLQLGIAGPNDYLVYGPVMTGSVPTGVVVQTSFDTYVSYSLMGGP
jgi:hypothetical protein